MNKTIVIIEDDAAILEVMTITLEEAGYKVVGLNSVISLDLLASLQADCFIIDEFLPFINGHIVCLMLKARQETCSIPVILISAFEELETCAGLCKANGFLQKPFLNLNVLTSLVRLMSCS